jgi:outer membrane receptor protein involved in Fe transport
VDVEIGYRRAVRLFRDGGERLGLRVFWSHLSENATQTDRANPVTYTNFAGAVGATSLPADAITGILTYSAGPFHMSMAARHIGKGVNNATWNQPLQRPHVADNTIGSVTYLNLEGGYAWDRAGGRLELYVDVQNVFDRDPPMIPQLFDNTLAQAINNGGTNPGLYDMLGRRFTLGVRFHH